MSRRAGAVLAAVAGVLAGLFGGGIWWLVAPTTLPAFIVGVPLAILVGIAVAVTVKMREPAPSLDVDRMHRAH